MDLSLEITAINYLLSTHWGWAVFKNPPHCTTALLFLGLSFLLWLFVVCILHWVSNTIPWTQKMLLETVGRKGMSLS